MLLVALLFVAVLVLFATFIVFSFLLCVVLGYVRVIVSLDVHCHVIIPQSELASVGVLADTV